MLFNPFPEPCHQYVEYEPWTGWEPWAAGGWGLADESGVPVPHQLVETHEALSGADPGLTRVVFRAELPPMGYRLYRFAPRSQQATVSEGARATPTMIENDRLCVRLDRDTGVIASCVDRRTGTELAGPGGWKAYPPSPPQRAHRQHPSRCPCRELSAYSQDWPAGRCG